ncbi:WhiB family transcriptional regulator [Kitasatospora sp. NPDC001175]|uniref:WhiB family transcriptional regulator n=1 Tax=Kitasatospora sp. NPDC001175 TaxID=3157103 RepID=UPI003D05BA16
MSTTWRDEARCRQTGPDFFFLRHYKPNDHRVVAAKQTCERCPVRVECLTEALDSERTTGVTSHDGIWGGYTPRERDAMRTGRAVSNLIATHGTYQAWLFGCRCDTCTQAASVGTADPQPEAA